jgi:hypothetical protein
VFIANSRQWIAEHASMRFHKLIVLGERQANRGYLPQQALPSSQHAAPSRQHSCTDEQQAWLVSQHFMPLAQQPILLVATQHALVFLPLSQQARLFLQQSAFSAVAA